MAVRFEKVSPAQFSCSPLPADVNAADAYESIKMPHRATACSAGYDLYAPFGFTVEPGGEFLVPTGLRILLESDMFLAVYPRSGLGFKFRLGLANTVGIIDADYSLAKNEGHIMVKLVNNGTKTVSVEAGTAFAQGIIQRYCITDDDNADGIRQGGMGSTDKK